MVSSELATAELGIGGWARERWHGDDELERRRRGSGCATWAVSWPAGFNGDRLNRRGRSRLCLGDGDGLGLFGHGLQRRILSGHRRGVCGIMGAEGAGWWVTRWRRTGELDLREHGAAAGRTGQSCDRAGIKDVVG
ncbi:hypothetical protein M0R45_029771 [Rubus argutus]|uniref:Uncharacterized protein n=1 Tax=Rubus argutus TaxID=59490 RepID=A0AAW1W9X1_RUBAR